MKSLLKRRVSRTLSTMAAVCFLSVQLAAWFPVTVQADAADDLKEIEYKYYFRGDYEKAIDGLTAFLERDGLTASQVVEAREYLAASLVLLGATSAGQEQFLVLLKQDASYAGPDPAVFKASIITAFEGARAEYASAVIRTVPDTAMSGDVSPEPAPAVAQGKPLYKKWWFYATMAGVVLVIAAAAGGGNSDEEPAPGQGTLSIDVDVR